MIKKIVCILCNDLDALKINFANMPKQSEDISFVIFSDERVKDISKEISSFIEELRTKIKNRIKLVSAKQTNDFVIENLKGLSDSGRSYVKEYTMGLNINMQYFIMKKVQGSKKAIFLDDDVIICGDLEEVFKENETLYCGNCFSTGGRGWENEENVDEFVKEILNLAKVDVDTWKTKNVSGCCRMLICDKEEERMYEKVLVEFYNSEVFRKNFGIYRKTGRNKCKSFFQDQYFENCFLWRVGKQNGRMDKYCRNIFVYVSKKGKCIGLKNKRKYFEKVMLHYGVGKHKKRFIDDMVEEGLLKRW